MKPTPEDKPLSEVEIKQINQCWAYKDDGTLCRGPAEHYDVQRGFYVCAAHDARPKTHCPTPAEEEAEATLRNFFAEQKVIFEERRAAVTQALPALERLVEVLKQRSGQPYKLRAILFSLWNGKPAPVNALLGLDWSLKKDVCAVLLAFGWEDDGTAFGSGREPEPVNFFYDALHDAICKAGQWEWFIEESRDVELLKEYVEAAQAAGAPKAMTCSKGNT